MLIPPPPLHLCQLQLSDLTAVAEIEKDSFPTPTKERTYRYELSENKLAHYQALTIKRENSEKLIGYAGYWLIADEVHISTIAVNPQWRGRGLGELILLNQIHLAYDQHAALVTLEVRESNKVAQDLYLKYDFEIVGRRRRYYKDTGEDAILMTVYLKDEYRQFLMDKQNALFSQLTSAPY